MNSNTAGFFGSRQTAAGSQQSKNFIKGIKIYQKICKGIKFNGKSYIATLGITPYKNNWLNFHLGCYDSLEEAEEILEKARTLKESLEGELLVMTLKNLKETKYRTSKLFCCGHHLHKDWSFCPYCGTKIKKE